MACRNERIRLIGIDCAASEEKTGLAMLAPDAEGYRLERVSTGSQSLPAESVLTDWIGESLSEGCRLLLCFDSPLGWPAAFAEQLAGHAAGGAIASDPDSFFKRATDRRVSDELGKRPLEVTANYIARTAFRALALADRLRSRFGGLELLWSADGLERIGMIEVYPAAWLIAERVDHADYKKLAAVRERIVCELRERGVRIGHAEAERVIRSDHMLDAVLCAMNGIDFWNGDCVVPDTADADRLRKEGWIWFKTKREAASSLVEGSDRNEQ
ncbi:DUF429 domain-containing protein [Paenibacillus flagellatus]|uniref:DUF429 domain-containing protein n=1 Tax=Paenibacillus flagellatus TaxID=2211139 RepID=A0A2V5KZU4_9BACL|nr:DUF429 domain-containing protein [Paenibacillus flagellatus]PYI55746.1 DUF429 domain-containing protein [Paenibacillus flagellatus]